MSVFFPAAAGAKAAVAAAGCRDSPPATGALLSGDAVHGPQGVGDRGLRRSYRFLVGDAGRCARQEGLGGLGDWAAWAMALAGSGGAAWSKKPSSCSGKGIARGAFLGGDVADGLEEP